MNITNDKGITLSILVVTIILMLILVGTTINIVLNQNGILDRTSESKFKTELAHAIEEYEYFLNTKSREDVQFEKTSLMIGKDYIYYNTKKIDETGNIYTVISKCSKEYVDDLKVIGGELYYTNLNGEKQKWAQDLGLKIDE